MEPFHEKWKLIIALIGKLIHCEQATGAPGMARDKDQFIFTCAVIAPLQVMLNLNRLAVFVDPEETNIEVEPGIFEIIRVAAKKSDLLFGRKNEAHVRIFFVTVKMIFAALE